MLMPTKTRALRNAMSIDVEDYFQVSAFAPYIRREAWNGLECRVERNIDRILTLLAEKDVHATFFTLGWIAERYPQVVKAIVAGGHELASHGYGHERASDLSPAAFLEDIASAKKLLEDLGGVPVVGYRAPSFSIGKGNLWAFDVLRDAGYRYSSSVYPIAHDHYGMPDSPRFAYPVREGLLEIPVTTLRVGSRNLPSSGGGYFRLLPYALSRWMIRRVNQTDGEQPRIAGIDAKTRFRHYVNIPRTHDRIGRLLGDFRWGRMDEIFLGREASPRAPAPSLSPA
jgi:polysaccharide deacetylase family protein (PEP-CTERM system associated)